jgi:undecaprenyl diphosphate synthase
VAPPVPGGGPPARAHRPPARLPQSAPQPRPQAGLMEILMKPVVTQPALPGHVAIIMDGNGRWAERRGLPRLAGHERGAEAVRRTVKAARAEGLQVLTLYAFSEQNWGRPEREVSHLMGLLQGFLERERQELCDSGVRLRAIGDRERLPAAVRDQLERTERATAATDSPVLDLCLAISYGSREDLVRVARQLATAAQRGAIQPADIDQARIGAALASGGLPPVDLLIRTSGEQRLSNFFLWEAAYAELHFTPCLWPDFDAAALRASLDAYGRRDRRFGLVRAAAG